MVKAALSLHTRAEPMKGMPSERWNGHSRRHGNGMRTELRACRTLREQNFGMKRTQNFGMTKLDRTVRQDNSYPSAGYLAGPPGLEPADGGTKIRCLSTWLRPKESRT